MINANTKIVFGNSEKATVAVTAKKGTVTLQELTSEKKIGDKLDLVVDENLPKVELEFRTVESIDILIKALQTIKSNYVPPPPKEGNLADCA